MFLDTGAWIALVVSRDSRHAQARGFFLSLPTSTRLVTSNYVLAETYSWLARNRLHRSAIEVRSMVLAAQQTQRLSIAWVTQELEDEAWGVFLHYDDQRFSFYDCTTVAICRSLGVESVFGFDADFRIAGLDLRPGP